MWAKLRKISFYSAVIIQTHTQRSRTYYVMWSVDHEVMGNNTSNIATTTTTTTT